MAFFELKDKHQERLDRLCVLCDPLIDSNLLANSAFDVLAWVYRSRCRDLVVNVSPSGIRTLAMSSLVRRRGTRLDTSGLSEPLS